MPVGVRDRSVRGFLIVLVVSVGSLAACSAAPPIFAPGVAAPTTSVPSALPSATPDVSGKLQCDDRYPRLIPIKSMLPNGQEVCVTDKGDREVLPSLCPSESNPLPTDQRALRHTVSEKLSSGEAPTVYTQTVLVFKPGGAVTYLNRLRTAMNSCPSHVRDGVKITYMRVDGPKAGDETVSMRAEHRLPKPVEGMPQVSTFRVIALRSGDKVSVIYDHGWEGAPSQDQTIFKAVTDSVRLLKAA